MTVNDKNENAHEGTRKHSQHLMRQGTSNNLKLS